MVKNYKFKNIFESYLNEVVRSVDNSSGKMPSAETLNASRERLKQQRAQELIKMRDSMVNQGIPMGSNVRVNADGSVSKVNQQTPVQPTQFAPKTQPIPTTIQSSPVQQTQVNQPTNNESGDDVEIVSKKAINTNPIAASDGEFGKKNNASTSGTISNTSVKPQKQTIKSTKPSGVSGSWSGSSYGENINVKIGPSGSLILTNSGGANSGSWSSQGSGQYAVNIAGQSGTMVPLDSSTLSLTIGGSTIELKKGAANDEEDENIYATKNGQKFINFEKINISKFLKHISEKNYSSAHKYLKAILNSKINNNVLERIEKKIK